VARSIAGFWRFYVGTPMCGISFILDKKGVLDEKPIFGMNQSILHRGPDNSGFAEVRKNGKNYYFAASRLKIMDLSDHANQPFISDDGNHILAFNGEIYNFHDLKNTLLKKGYRFRSSSDTEVLLYVLIEHGENAIEQLDGMYAFIYFDKINGRLIAARDKSGMKPLFYFENDLFLIICSQIKGILSSGLVTKELNTHQVPYYLRFRFARKPETFFKNIFELEEGKTLLKDGNGAMTVKSFKELNLQSGTSSHQSTGVADKNNIEERVQELIYDAFLRHTIADAPLGLFLSGGVDSTLLLAYAKQEMIHMPTFSIVPDRDYGSFGTQDGHYSRLAVSKFGNSIDHHEIVYSISILDEMDELIGAMDQPIADSATLLTWYLARFAREKVKSVLSGAGADELFAGYNRHGAYHHYLTHFKKYQRFQGFLKFMGNLLPAGFDHPYRKQFRLAKKFVKELAADPFQTYLNFTSLGFGASQNTVNNPASAGPNINDLFGNALQHDLHNYLVSDVLTLNDRMSMAHGLEMRMPYLDDHLRDFVTSLDPVFLIEGGRKWILKSILAKFGGNEFCNRSKDGFGLPLGNWIRMKRVEMDEIFNEKQQIIGKFVSLEQIRRMYHDHVRQKCDHTSELWAYLVLVKWLKANGLSDL
jgi:asparagine synthase (glutamine-hydrolysing)